MNEESRNERADEQAWEALGRVENDPRVQQWLAAADVVVATTRKAAQRPHARWWQLAAAAAVCAFALGMGGYWYWAPPHYQTGLGEQRDVTLSDGSRITLNTDTAVTVRYSKARRFITLQRGEALFAVKRDTTRPFEVEAGGAVTRALGTEFNVDLRGQKVIVSVLEGTVSVVPVDTKSGSGVAIPGPGRLDVPRIAMTALSKGQAVEFRAQDGRMDEQRADLRRIDAWRTRRLEFTDTPLSEAVNEFNRYSTTRLVVGTPDLGSVRVSGVFRIGDAEGFLYSLRETLDVETHESSGDVILMRSAQ